MYRRLPAGKGRVDPKGVVEAQMPARRRRYIFSHDPCVRGEAFRWLSGFRHSSLEIDAQVELDLPHRAASRHPAEIERIHYCPHSRKIRMVEHVGNQPAELDAAVVVIQAEAFSE